MAATQIVSNQVDSRFALRNITTEPVSIHSQKIGEAHPLVRRNATLSKPYWIYPIAISPSPTATLGGQNVDYRIPKGTGIIVHTELQMDVDAPSAGNFSNFAGYGPIRGGMHYSVGGTEVCRMENYHPYLHMYEQMSPTQKLIMNQMIGSTGAGAAKVYRLPVLLPNGTMATPFYNGAIDDDIVLTLHTIATADQITQGAASTVTLNSLRLIVWYMQLPPSEATIFKNNIRSHRQEMLVPTFEFKSSRISSGDTTNSVQTAFTRQSVGVFGFIQLDNDMDTTAVDLYNAHLPVTIYFEADSHAIVHAYNNTSSGLPYDDLRYSQLLFKQTRDYILSEACIHLSWSLHGTGMINAVPMDQFSGQNWTVTFANPSDDGYLYLTNIGVAKYIVAGGVMQCASNN